MPPRDGMLGLDCGWSSQHEMTLLIGALTNRRSKRCARSSGPIIGERIFDSHRFTSVNYDEPIDPPKSSCCRWAVVARPLGLW